MFSEARFVKAMLREYELCVNARFARASLACLGSGRRVGVELEAPRLRPRAGAGS